MSRHTPGPWRWEDPLKEDPEARARRLVLTAVRPDFVFAHELVSDTNRTWVVDSGLNLGGYRHDLVIDSPSDAALIAAAPDLLEAAEALDAALEPWMYAAMPGAWGRAIANIVRERLQALKDAIATATMQKEDVAG